MWYNEPMDARIRELERLVAQGDVAAQKQLKQIWARLRLVPSDDELMLMQCGFAISGEEAILPVIKIWQHLLTVLLEGARQEWRSRIIDYHEENGLAPNTNGLLDEVKADMEEYLYGVSALSNVVKRWLDVDVNDEEAVEILQAGNYTGIQGLDMLDALHQAFQQALGSPYGGLNYHRDRNRDLPPLYLHHNDVTQSLRISYLDPKEEPWEEASETRDFYRRTPTKFDTTIRKIRDGWQVSISWNVGDRFNPLTAEYDNPYTLEELCVPFFSLIPCCLQDVPGLWKEWGWGACNEQVRSFGNWDYDPIVSELGSMHWLYPPSS
jgi:hypothetical protein